MHKATIKILFAWICFTALGVHAAEEIGLVLALQGTARGIRQDGTTSVLNIRTPIFLHDRVITDARTKMQIMLHDDTLISLGADSEMTIDEYVYSPENAKDNTTSIGMFRGVFRVITGKITKLNPDRFRVRTSLATIGIRGCDVGFRISNEKHDFYIIHLHGFESVVVQARAGDNDADWQDLTNRGGADPAAMRAKLIKVLQPNRIVSIKATGELEDREMTPGELLELINAVMPQGASEDIRGPAESGNDDQAPPPHTDEDPNDQDARLLADDTPSTPSDTVSDDILRDTDRSTDLESSSTRDDPSSTRDDPSLETGTPNNGSLDPIRDVPESIYRQKGAGDGWDWGLWETDGVVDRVDFRALQPISAADFQSLMNGTYLYDLQGNGVAAALIRHGGAKSLVQGTAELRVQVGYGYMPNWDGIFDMQNASSDSLYFKVLNGIIQSDGKMTGNHDVSTYSLYVNGTPFASGTITAESISGQLVGPGTGSIPITGAVGSFSFDHGGAAQVQGGFGSNLSEF